MSTATTTTLLPPTCTLRADLGQPLVGLCVDDRHPTLAGRVLIRWDIDGATHERWLPCLHHLAVRRDDRVLLITPANSDEAIVLGLIDGLRERAQPTREAAHLELKVGESIRLADDAGQPLLDLIPGDGQVELRLAQPTVGITLPGVLRLAADAIEFQAKQGVTITAGADVVMTGENIALN